MVTINKQHVKQITARLAKLGVKTHTAQTIFAEVLGTKNWNALSAQLDNAAPVRRAPNPIAASLINAASVSYDDGLVAQAYDPDTNTVSRGVVGDTLAEFIAIEIIEVTEGETDATAAAICAVGAIEKAMDQLQHVHSALDSVALKENTLVLHREQDSGEIWTDDQLSSEIEDVQDRVSTGEFMPSGQAEFSASLTHEYTIYDKYSHYAEVVKWIRDYREWSNENLFISIVPMGANSCRLHFYREMGFCIPSLTISDASPKFANADGGKRPEAQIDALLGNRSFVQLSSPRLAYNLGRDFTFSAISRKADGRIVIARDGAELGDVDSLHPLTLRIVLDALELQAATPKPSQAFEVTVDDVALVVADTRSYCTEFDADMLFARFIAPHAGPGGRIEKAALHGGALDTQTVYAQGEIRKILLEAGALRKR